MFKSVWRMRVFPCVRNFSYFVPKIYFFLELEAAVVHFTLAESCVQGAFLMFIEIECSRLSYFKIIIFVLEIITYRSIHAFSVDSLFIKNWVSAPYFILFKMVPFILTPLNSAGIP